MTHTLPNLRVVKIILFSGDFNSDELTDIFVLRDSFRTIEILLGSDVDQLLHRTKLSCHYPHHHITSVVPGDFDGDAFMDVMTVVKMEGEKVGVLIHWGGSDHLNCSSNDTNPLVMIGEPLALDYNDDMVIDLFGMDEEGVRTFWLYEKDSRAEPKKVPLAPADLSQPTAKMSVPHSHAFLDMNDDFYADLFITTEDNKVEIWLASDASTGHRFQYNRTINYSPPGSHNRHYGQSIFLDMELNGSLNQLLPVCHNEDCTNSTIWIQADQHYHDLNINFYQDDNKTLWGFLKPDKGDFFRRTITLRTGDFNNDGFPDLLATLQKKDNTIQTFLLENVRDINAKPTDKFKRTFAVRWDALSPFGENTVIGSFYDFYQDGILDVILLQKNGDKYKPLAFKNSLDYDANFVKVIVLTGLSNKKPPAKETPFGAKRRNYGK